jgi:hypothetical protein
MWRLGPGDGEVSNWIYYHVCLVPNRVSIDVTPSVALCTTKVDYGALSTSLRDVIHMMQIVKEASALGWKTFYLQCTARYSKTMRGTLEWARLPKMRAKTKHI